MKKTIFPLIVFLFLAGCQTTASFQQSRDMGFMCFNNAAAALNQSDFSYEFKGCAKIIVYGSPKKLRAKLHEFERGGDANVSKERFDYEMLSNEDMIQYAGFARMVEGSIPEIHILGSKHPETGKIYINEAFLGHEILHLLNYSNSDFMDPDQGLYD